MRAQFAILQKRLDKQVEISNRQLRNAISTGIGEMNTRDNKSVFLCILAWVAIAGYAFASNFSLAFQIFINIAMGGNFIASLVMREYAKGLNNSEMSSYNLIRTSHELLRYKRFRQKYLLYASIPFILVFVPWYCYEIMQATHASDTKEIIPILIAVLAGAIIGLAIGLFRFYFPSVRQATEMMCKIEELQKENSEA